MPLLKGISKPFAWLLQSWLTKIICVYSLIQNERIKINLPLPTHSNIPPNSLTLKTANTSREFFP